MFTNREGTCDDGNACTTDTACVLGVCTGAAVVCDDGVPCTNDLCQADIGCVFNPINDRCDDGDPCSDNLCTEAGCTYPTASDFTPCGDVACDIAELCVAGACQEVPAFDGLPCDDGVEGSVGAVCEDGVCLEGDVAPDVSIVWSNAEHTDLFYDVTEVSALDDIRIAVSTRRNGDADAVHLLSAGNSTDLEYKGRVQNLEGSARFFPIGGNRFARVDFDRIPGRTGVEVLFEISAGEFVIENQTSYNVAVPANAQDGVVSFDQGIGFCAGTPDANGTITTPLSLVRFDLSEIGNPERMNDLPDPAADPCRGDQGFFFSQASGSIMAVGSDAGGFLGEAIYFYDVSAAGAERIGIADGRWRHPTIGPGTFVFRRVDDDVVVFARFDGQAFNTGTLDSPCVYETGVRPFAAKDGATFWQTVAGAGTPNYVCRVDVPTADGAEGEVAQWSGIADSGNASQFAPGVVVGDVCVRHFAIPDDGRTVGQLQALSTAGATQRTVRNQGQVWDLRKNTVGNIVFHANTQGAMLRQEVLRESNPVGFTYALPPPGVDNASIASTTLLASNFVGSLRYAPPFAGHCDPTLTQTCFAPPTFGIELGRYTTIFGVTGSIASELGTSFEVMTSATKIESCLGVGVSAFTGQIGEFASSDNLRVVSICSPSVGSTFVGNLSPRQGEFFRLRDSFPHGDTHVSADIVYVTPASSTPFEAEMVLIDVQQSNAPDIIATVPLTLDPFATSAAYSDGVWAVVEQPVSEAQTTLTVVEIETQTTRSVSIGVTSRKYPARVLLVEDGFVYVNGVRPAAPEPFAEDAPFLNVYKRVGENLLLAVELEETRNFTAMMPLDDGSILAADDVGWRTFILAPNPPDP